jgi:hypothetical protein
MDGVTDGVGVFDAVLEPDQEDNGVRDGVGVPYTSSASSHTDPPMYPYTSTYNVVCKLVC